MKYAWIAQHRDSHPVSLLCEVLGVSRSGDYAWLNRAPGPRARRRERIDAVRQAKKLAGCDELETACRNTVAQAMREMGLKSRVSKAFWPTTTQAGRSTTTYAAPTWNRWPSFSASLIASTLPSIRLCHPCRQLLARVAAGPSPGLGRAAGIRTRVICLGN